MKVHLNKILILPILTIMLILPNFCLASECDWSTIQTVSNGYLYNNDCHNQVGIMVENEKDYRIQIDSQKKAIELKDLTIKDLRVNSDMWEKEAHVQFQSLENYKKAETTRTWLWFGGGVAATVLVIVLAGQVSN